ncbi:MAG TPA: ABC transporter permease subunit [bacterium]|nr:ABC transporter permease subunit [bacterium]
MRSRTGGSWGQGALGLALVLPPLCVLVFLIVVPAITAVVDTLRPPEALAGGVTLAAYAQVLGSRILRADIVFSVVVTLVAVAATFCLSYPLAMYLRFNRGRLPSLLAVLFTIPLFVPVVIASFAMITFLVNHGMVSTIVYRLGIERLPPLVYNATGIVLTEVWTTIPFAVLILGAGLQSIDDALIDSARDVGAGRLRTFASIILPLNATPTMITLTLLFIGIFGSFTIPYLVGGNAPQMLGVTMTNYLTQYLRRTESVTIAVIAFVIAAAVGAVYVVSVSRRERHAL